MKEPDDLKLVIKPTPEKPVQTPNIVSTEDNTNLLLWGVISIMSVSTYIDIGPHNQKSLGKNDELKHHDAIIAMRISVREIDKPCNINLLSDFNNSSTNTSWGISISKEKVKSSRK